MRKKLEKVYKFKAGTTRKVVMVGCGGNGSMLAPHLSRLISTINANRNPHEHIELTFVDGDVVEEKNLIRQHFVSSDIGKNKAEALASRYSKAFGIEISYLTGYMTNRIANDVLVSHETLCITCTDNLSSRKIVNDYRDIGWIDLGNEQDAGQVVASHTMSKDWGTHYIGNEGFFALPTVFELFPEYMVKVKSEVPIEERSCAEMAQESPIQAGFVNNTAAAIAMNYVHAFLTRRPIVNHMTFFSIDNSYEHRSINESAISRWIAEFPRFERYKIS